MSCWQQASSTNAHDIARCSQTGVFRVHLEDDLVDDTPLVVEVEKQKVIYDPKNLMYKDLQAKEKAWDAVDWSFDNTRSDKRINTYSDTSHKYYTCSYTK